MRIAFVGGPPNLSEQLTMRHNFVDVPRQRGDQTKLDRREVNRLSVAKRRALVEIDRRVLESQHVAAASRPNSMAQCDADARE